jgi:hypothetical protein
VVAAGWPGARSRAPRRLVAAAGGRWLARRALCVRLAGRSPPPGRNPRAPRLVRAARADRRVRHGAPPRRVRAAYQWRRRRRAWRAGDHRPSARYWRSGGPRRARPCLGFPPVGAEVLREAPSGASPGRGAPGLPRPSTPARPALVLRSPPPLLPSHGGCLSARGPYRASCHPAACPSPSARAKRRVLRGVACSATIVPIASAHRL